MVNWKGIFSGDAVQEIEVYVDDTFHIEVSIPDSGQVLFRNVACGLTWPVGVISPRTSDGTLVYTDGTLFSGLDYDLIVKQVGDEIGFSKSLKTGNSVSQIGSIASVEFIAMEVGEGEIVLTKLEANDIENGQQVSRYTASEGKVSISSFTPTQPTGTVLFRVRVIK